MSILIVDDDPMICTLVRRMLQQAGYSVREAYSGEQALEAIAVMPPALVLVDRMMPGMTGDELVVCLRAEHNPLPCILMSALTDDPKIDGLPFLAKPFAMDALLNLVGRTLDRHQNQNPLPVASTGESSGVTISNCLVW
jgi:DNA-binding response OmpR family regulator